ncbi:MAG TPA: thioredoxin domain-containing protein [Brachybacterium sp.]|nr:thioredoxin domain-containing protein [Brachybacterium sp.]
MVRRDPDDPRAIGDVDAPVVLVRWTDLRCPSCASFHRDVSREDLIAFAETSGVPDMEQFTADLDSPS